MEPRKLAGHPRSIRSLTFTPDGSRILSGGFDKAIRLWDRATGEQIGQLDGHDGVVTALTVLTDGARALSASDKDGTLRVWDLQELKALKVFSDRSHWSDGSVCWRWGLAGRGPSALVWHTNDHQCGTLAVVCNVETGRCSEVPVGAKMDSACLSADAAVVATHHHTIALWPAGPGARPRSELRAACSKLLAFAPDGSKLLYCDHSALVVIDVANGAELGRRPGTAGCFNPDGTMVLLGGDTGLMALMTMPDGRILAEADGHEACISAVAIADDGTCAASADEKGGLIIWDVT